jgi:hypothetical protein
MKIFRLGMKIDEKSKTDVTKTRRASFDVGAMLDFSSHRKSFGLKSAMPLFKKISFTFDDISVNPPGDIFSSFIFSEKAKELIFKVEPNIQFIEPIKISGKKLKIDAYYVAPIHFSEPVDFKSLGRWLPGLAGLNIFSVSYPHHATYVSERFKLAWEAAGLTGARFDEYDAAKLTIDAIAAKERRDKEKARRW